MDAVELVICNNVTGLRQLDRHLGAATYTLPCEKCIMLSCHNLSLMHIAAFYDSLDCLIELQNVGCTILDRSANSELPIHYACYNGSLEVACYIFAVNPGQARVNVENVMSQICLAALCGHVGILQLLIDNGANISSQTISMKDPMYCALSSRNIEFAKLLALKQAPNKLGACPLLITAVRQNAMEIIPCLLERGEDPSIGQGEVTALFLACEKGPKWLGVVNLLLASLPEGKIDPVISSSVPTSGMGKEQSTGRCRVDAQRLCRLYVRLGVLM